MAFISLPRNGVRKLNFLAPSLLPPPAEIKVNCFYIINVIEIEALSSTEDRSTFIERIVRGFNTPELGGE